MLIALTTKRGCLCPHLSELGKPVTALNNRRWHKWCVVTLELGRKRPCIFHLDLLKC